MQKSKEHKSAIITAQFQFEAFIPYPNPAECIPFTMTSLGELEMAVYNAA